MRSSLGPSGRRGRSGMSSRDAVVGASLRNIPYVSGKSGRARSERARSARAGHDPLQFPSKRGNLPIGGVVASVVVVLCNAVVVISIVSVAFAAVVMVG